MTDTLQQTNGSLLLSQPGQSGLGDVYNRLRSFTATTWFGKPAQLSAQECAGKGWTNTGPDQLTCHSCGSQILCKLPLNPWSEAAAGIVNKYSQRLIDAHSPQCRQRSLLSLDQPRSNSSLGFPIIPSKKLSAAYYSRLHELQQIQSLPYVSVSTRAQLAAAAARLDSSILSGLSALLQIPLDSLKHEAAAAVTAGSTAALIAGSSSGMYLPQEQAQILISLCGWQPKQLLPPHLAPAAAADTSGTLLGVAHLLPSRRHSSSAGHAGGAGNTAAGKPGAFL